MELDLKGNEKLDKLKASLSDVKESVENVTDTTHGLDESMRGLANIGMVFNSLNNAFDILKQGVSALATEFNSFDKGMRAVNTMAFMCLPVIPELKLTDRGLFDSLRWQFV